MKQKTVFLHVMVFLFVMLMPLAVFAEESPAEKLNFNQGWKFVRRNIEEAVEVDYPMEELEQWENVDLPHTVRVEPYNNSGGINYQGEAMYRKHFKLSPSYAGKKLYIEFEGVMGVTDVWVNGTHLQSKMAAKTGDNTQYGGYLPFVLDVTDAVHCDDEYNVITVLTDNRDNETVPPGKKQSELDYSYFGGIYRNVWLEVKNPVHITNTVYEDIVAGGGILVEYPEISEERAAVSVKTVVTDSETYAIAKGSGYTFSQNLQVGKPNLWNLDRPYMWAMRLLRICRNGML